MDAVERNSTMYNDHESFSKWCLRLVKKGAKYVLPIILAIVGISYAITKFQLEKYAVYAYWAYVSFLGLIGLFMICLIVGSVIDVVIDMRKHGEL